MAVQLSFCLTTLKIRGLIFIKTLWIKSSSWVCRCDEEYLEEFKKEKFLKYSLLLSILTRNRLDPVDLCWQFLSKITLNGTFRCKKFHVQIRQVEESIRDLYLNFFLLLRQSVFNSDKSLKKMHF